VAQPAELVPAPPARPDYPPVPWRWWEALVVFLIGSVVGAILIAPVAAGIHTHRLQDATAALVAEAAIGGTAFLWLFGMHRRALPALGFPARIAVELLAGFVAGLVIYGAGVFLIGTVIAVIIQAASSEAVHAPRQIPHPDTALQIGIEAIAVIAVAPFSEELLFRGMLFRSLRARMAFPVAGVLSAVAFGAVHWVPGAKWQNAILLVSVMCFVGFGLAYLYERRGTIVAPMAAHATFNVIGFVAIVLLR
jgi:membrane protease YdiL (CAAX protease family)